MMGMGKLADKISVLMLKADGCYSMGRTCIILALTSIRHRESLEEMDVVTGCPDIMVPVSF
jgi:hypothetical protein